MTDSETLRAVLKERGIKYETRDAFGACETSWCGYTAYQLTPESKLIMHPTPEQAIAATVGEEYEMHICKRCGVAYELSIIDKGFGKPRFCPNCGHREVYQ